MYHWLHNYPNILILSTDCYVLGDLILHSLYTNNYNTLSIAIIKHTDLEKVLVRLVLS